MKPNQIVLKTPEECEQALKEGWVLINPQGWCVWHKDGEQLRNNPKRDRRYSFSNPRCWRKSWQQKQEVPYEFIFWVVALVSLLILSII